MLRLFESFYHGTNSTAKIRSESSLSSMYQIVNGSLFCIIFLLWICELMDAVHRDKMGYTDDVCAVLHRPYTQAQAAQILPAEVEELGGRVNLAVLQLGGAQAMLDPIGAYG